MIRRFREEAGANAVEFALVLPLLITLIFGALWGGLALNSQVALSQSAREAARFGATLPFPEPITNEAGWTAWLNDVEGRVGEATRAQMTASSVVSGCVRAVSVSGAGAPVVRTRSINGGTCGAASLVDATSGTAGMSRVEVEVEVAAFDIGSLFPATRLTSEAVARHEGPRA